MPHKNVEDRKAYMKKRRAEKPEFHKASIKRNALKQPALAKARNLKYRNSEKGKMTIRNGQLKAMYGITLDDYNVMLQEQNCQCLICQTSIAMFASENFEVAHVDHCHETGEVRGLLCHRCNKALGGFRDDPEVIKRAYQYLTKFK